MPKKISKQLYWKYIIQNNIKYTYYINIYAHNQHYISEALKDLKYNLF